MLPGERQEPDTPVPGLSLRDARRMIRLDDTSVATLVRLARRLAVLAAWVLYYV